MKKLKNISLAFFIACRYLISKKKQNIINVISWISTVGIATGTLALVVVLSVFNGFNDLISSFFSILDPDLKITATEGKFFDPTYVTDSVLGKTAGIADYALVIEDNAILKYKDRQNVAVVKGVSDNFASMINIDDFMFGGAFILKSDDVFYAVPGLGVFSFLGIDINFSDPLHFYFPRKGVVLSALSSNAMKHDYLYPVGIFSLLDEIDNSLVFVPFEFAAALFDSKDVVSAVEIKLSGDVPLKSVQKNLLLLTGGNYEVKDRYQQHDSMYKTMKSEKFVTYLILVFILIIASFNILGSLSMIIIDKEDDIAILNSMGASKGLLKHIFLYEGWLISIIGVVGGILLGVLICLAQIQFELIKLPGEGTFAVSAYPVKILFSDLFIVAALVLFVGFLAAWYPVRYITGKHSDEFLK
ncbi:MAG: FtsX-like permease family protein [Prolixibacteraceae bacterium]|nr:FtsX-like permease family protein [Prolixibacteraceae bacterium]